jgi:hypothetical protein
MNTHRGAGGAERNFKNLWATILKNDPHKAYLYMFFEPALKKAAEHIQGDPRMSVELLLDRYAQADPSLDIFQFNYVKLEESSYHVKLLFFRGAECFMVWRKANKVYVSEMYSDTASLKGLSFHNIAWAGEPHTIKDSLVE